MPLLPPIWVTLSTTSTTKLQCATRVFWESEQSKALCFYPSRQDLTWERKHLCLTLMRHWFTQVSTSWRHVTFDSQLTWMETTKQCTSMWDHSLKTSSEKCLSTTRSSCSQQASRSTLSPSSTSLTLEGSARQCCSESTALCTVRLASLWKTWVGWTEDLSTS